MQWVYSGKDWLVRDTNAPHVAREQWTVKFAPTVVENFEGVLGQRGQDRRRERRSSIWSRAAKRMPRTRSAQKRRRRVRNPTISTSPTRTPTKGTVVTTLSKLLSVPTGEIATIGDMPNDVLMFRKSGLSIAMGNASPEVQAQGRSGHRLQ